MVSLHLNFYQQALNFYAWANEMILIPQLSCTDTAAKGAQDISAISWILWALQIWNMACQPTMQVSLDKWQGCASGSWGTQTAPRNKAIVLIVSSSYLCFPTKQAGTDNFRYKIFESPQSDARVSTCWAQAGTVTEGTVMDSTGLCQETHKATRKPTLAYSIKRPLHGSLSTWSPKQNF